MVSNTKIARMKFVVGILTVALLLASNVDARGGRGGGSKGSSSRGSSSSSRGSSSSSRGSSTGSRTTTSSSSPSYGWRSPSTSTTSTSTSSSAYGWRNPSTSTSSSNYGWTNPSTSNTAIGGYRNPWGSSSSSSTWRSPSSSGLPTTTSGGNSFLWGRGRSGGDGSSTAMRLGALAGASRFRTRTRYRGGGFSFESNSIEDATVPARTVVLSASQSGTCNSAITQRNMTRPATAVNVTIYEDENQGGKNEVVELPPRQCVNVHMIDPTWNDKASSIDPGDACVMIWEHRDCTGKFACFRNGTRGVKSLRLVGLNDDLTSMQLC